VHYGAFRSGRRQLRNACEPHWPPLRGARRRPGERGQSDRDRDSLSSDLLALTERSLATAAGSRENNGFWRTKGSASREADSAIRDPAGTGIWGIAVVCTASVGESTGIRNLTDVGGKVVVK
jgi:hypothetical protein